MPRIVEYASVVAALEARGLRCVYHNSGAFAFADDATAQSVGWIGPDDPTLRPEARPLARPVPQPYAGNLSDMLVRAWGEFIGGAAWMMPTSHWVYELEFGSAAWMPDALREIGIDAARLGSRNDAAAVEFSLEEGDLLRTLALALLERLEGSDFTLAFPDCALICRLHHHKQLWWTTTEPQILWKLCALAEL